MRLVIRVARQLFEPADEFTQVGLLRLADHQNVQMIRHEAVRNNYELEQRRRLPKLLQRALNDGCRNEDVVAECCAEREEIPLVSDVRHAR